jgi:hypothetical protein
MRAGSEKKEPASFVFIKNKQILIRICPIYARSGRFMLVLGDLCAMEDYARNKGFTTANKH